MNPNMMRGVHPNSNNILQQRLTQQRMGVPTTLPMHTQNQAPQGMMRVNRMPMQHGPRPGMPMGGPGPNQNPAIYSINPSPGSMVQVSSPAMIQMPGQSPMGGGHFVPSPQQQQPGGPAGAGVPSPGGPRMSMAPSPQSTSIRTPQNNADNAPQTPEEQAYLDKVRQLGKYIEPLRKMIAKIGNEDQEKLKKMTKLMDILSNPNKRLAYDVLLRCESVLKHMISDDPNESSSGLLHDSSSNINPLLDSVIKLKNHRMAATSLSLNHTLCRTFSSSLDAINGPEMTLPPVKRRKRCTDQGQAGKETHAGIGAVHDVLPDHIQGEVAQLHSRFKVSLETSQPHILPHGTIDLLCVIEDNDLPAVPPITITLQPNYPDESSPQLHDSAVEYETSTFLRRVREALLSRMRKIPNRFTLTQLLAAWEMSVRAACSYRGQPTDGNGIGYEIPAIPASITA